MRLVRLLALALLLGAPLGAAASDAPHEEGGDCSNCHLSHRAVGGAYTKQLGNFNLCQSCHATCTNFGFPWTAGDQAAPGSRGRSHRWDAAATNLGATAPNRFSADPVEAAMGKHLDAGANLSCSTCHDQHKADVFRTDATIHVSTPAVTGTGNGTLTVATPPNSAAAKAYLIDVVTAGSSTTARFRLSNDNGTSWFGCTAPTSYTYVAYSGTNGCQAGSGIVLNDGANVTVTFGGTTLNAGDRMRFYVSYPFLRGDNAASRMCVTCHRDRDMRWQDVEGGNANGIPGGVKAVTLGTTVFHHPVNQQLAKPYDRAAAAILDVDGSLQSGGTEGKRTNDLALGSGSVVHCMSCHHPHNADSNSLSEDPR